MSINVHSCDPLNKKLTYNNLIFNTDKSRGDSHQPSFLSFQNGNTPQVFKWKSSLDWL